MHLPYWREAVARYNNFTYPPQTSLSAFLFFIQLSRACHIEIIKPVQFPDLILKDFIVIREI